MGAGGKKVGVFDEQAFDLRTERNGDVDCRCDGGLAGGGEIAQPVRTDVSCTLFLSEPDSYDGGELIIEDTFGSHAVKLPAGHMVIYPGSSLHRVAPVTRGQRLASFFWVQSLIRDDAQRRILVELDVAIQQLTAAVPEHASLVQLTGVYHNLLRQWSET